RLRRRHCRTAPAAALRPSGVQHSEGFVQAGRSILERRPQPTLLPMTSPPRQGRLRSLFAHHGRLLFLAGLALASWLALAGSALPDGERTGRMLVRLAGSIVELWFTGLLLAGCMRMAARGRARPAWLALCWAISGLACAGYLVQAYSLQDRKRTRLNSSHVKNS